MPYRLVFFRHVGFDDLRHETLEEAFRAAVGMYLSGEAYVVGITKDDHEGYIGRWQVEQIAQMVAGSELTSRVYPEEGYGPDVAFENLLGARDFEADFTPRSDDLSTR